MYFSPMTFITYCCHKIYCIVVNNLVLSHDQFLRTNVIQSPYNHHIVVKYICIYIHIYMVSTSTYSQRNCDSVYAEATQDHELLKSFKFL